MDVSENSGTPQIIHFNRVFSIINHPFWGEHPYFWKHPNNGNMKISNSEFPQLNAGMDGGFIQHTYRTGLASFFRSKNFRLTQLGYAAKT